jgi:two-component system sensor kinase FixL
MADIAETLDDLGQDCRRAADVLGRLRQMFRRHETEQVPVAMATIVEHVLRLLHEEAVARGVKISLEIAPDVPLVVGDRVQLEQVIMNLLVNAFEALAGAQGERVVTLRVKAGPGSVCVEVVDNGTGIHPDDLERIFEPFFTRKPDGMGIGLAICRTIVEAHGGRIRASISAQGGTAIEILLPSATASAGSTFPGDGAA